MTADGERSNVVATEAGFMGGYGGDGVAFVAPDRLLVLRYMKSDTTLGPVFALGGKILVVVDTKLYQIEE